MIIKGTKFQRSFELAIEMTAGTSDAIIVRPPFTISFSITRNTLSSANTATIKILNLKENIRKRIYQDRFDTTTYRRVILKAGYENDVPVVFRGNLRMAQSTRVGVNYETELDCFDGGYAMVNGFTARTWPAETDKQSIAEDLVKDLPNVLLGKLGELTGTSYRGVSQIGNSWAALQKLAGEDSEVFIDNEQVNILQKNETIPASFKIINAAAGLLETPRRHDAVIEIKTLFEPHISIGQSVEIQSRETVYNGLYKVVGFTHSGTISEAVGGQCTTMMSLYVGAGKLKEVA